MKNVFSSLVVAFLIIVTLKAQPNLYGTTFLGGNFNKGALFTYAPATNTYTKLHDFAGFDGTYPDCSLIQAIDGKLYGTTLEGGATNHGILFSFDPATNTFVKRHDFTCQGGAKPLGDLVQASDGKLYGTTVNEGSTGYGVLYSFDPVSNAYAQLLEFTGPNGAFAHGNLIESSNKLFGTTEGGGTSGGGILFSYDPATNTFTKLHDYLLKEDGFDSRAKLVQASDGKLYGSTSLGGTTLFGYGVLFSFDPLSNTYTNLHHFNGLDGDNPLGGLVEAKNGELYGTTQHGGSDSVGVLFSFAPATNFYTKLHDFTGLDGKNPNGDLVSATDGNLYGMTTDGGTNNEGVIFSFNPVTNSFIKQHDFTGPDGSQPTSGLLEIKHIFPCKPPTFLNDQTIVLNASCTADDGNITIIPLTGTPPYQYSIDGGATYVSCANSGYTFQQLAAGTYYLRLRDANSCESAIVERTVRTLYGGPTFLNNNQIVLDASCKGNDGKIFIIPMSGKPPFQYSLNDGLTYTYGPAGGYTFTGLRAGTYQLRLKDARGCESKTVVKDVRPNAFGSCLTVWPFQRSAEPKETTVETRSFPNPTNGPFDIQLPNASGNLRAVLLDSKGTVVQQKAMIVSEGNRLHFDLSGKAKGLYLVKVITIKDVQVIKVNVQ